MQVISNEDLRRIIEEAKAAGKDVTELERSLEEDATRVSETVPPVGERRERATGKGKVIIESTGPAREEDFE